MWELNWEVCFLGYKVGWLGTVPGTGEDSHPWSQAGNDEDPSTWWPKYGALSFSTCPAHTYVSETRTRWWQLPADRVMCVTPCFSGRTCPSILLLLGWEGSRETPPLLAFKHKAEVQACIKLHHIHLFVRCWQPAYGTARRKCETRPPPVTAWLYCPDLDLSICTGQGSSNEVCAQCPATVSVNIVFSEGSERRE